MRVNTFVGCAILVAAFAQVASAKPVVAPADEYFGRMKLSILGIGNIMHDTKLREAYDPAHAGDNFTKLAAAEDALEDWAAKYPDDTWLPGKAYYMSHEFWAMNTADADLAAKRCRALLFSRFARSTYSFKARVEIASMFEPKPTTAVASSMATSGGSSVAGTALTASAAAAGPTPASAVPHP